MGIRRTLADEGTIIVKLMLVRTDEPRAPWHPIAAESKRYARVAVARTVIEAIEAGMRAWGQEPPATR